jgi:hypothetical protein
MDATFSAFLNEIYNSLSVIRFSPKRPIWLQIIEFIILLLAPIVALAIGLWKDDWRKKIEKSNIKAIKVNKHCQNSEYYYRLVLKNEGKYTAKNLEIDIEEVYDDKLKRKNFVPSPLRWTHRDTKPRDVFPSQTCQLDICNFRFKQGENLILTAPDIMNLKSIPFLKAGKSKLILKHYQENGQTGIIKLSVFWTGKENRKEENLPIVKLIPRVG